MRRIKNKLRLVTTGLWAALFMFEAPAISETASKETGTQKLPEQKANVEVTPVLTKEGEPSLKFLVRPSEGMLLTFEAPWSLKFESQSGFKTDKNSFSKTDMDEALPGFSIPLKAEAGTDEATVQYKLITFACTKDKKQCFREVHKNKFSFNNKQLQGKAPLPAGPKTTGVGSEAN